MIQADKTGVGELRIKSDGATIYVQPADIDRFIGLVIAMEPGRVRDAVKGGADKHGR